MFENIAFALYNDDKLRKFAIRGGFYVVG